MQSAANELAASTTDAVQVNLGFSHPGGHLQVATWTTAQKNGPRKLVDLRLQRRVCRYRNGEPMPQRIARCSSLAFGCPGTRAALGIGAVGLLLTAADHEGKLRGECWN